MMAESEEVVKLVDGAYKNILEKFNPCARQLISAGKQYLKALHGAVAASKAYIEALSKLARHAHQGTWGGCTDIGTALLQLVDVQKDIQAQQLNILKAFYVDLLVPLESNIDKDTKVVACEQKRFLQQHKGLQDSYLKAAAAVRKQRKKSKGGARAGGHLDKEIKTLQQLEEDKMKLDCFCERSLKQAITQERRRFGFVLERQCSLTKHSLVYHSQGQGLLQRHLEEWEEVAKAREALPGPIDQLFRASGGSYSTCSEYACANLLERAPPASLYASSPAHGGGGGGTLRKTRSIDASCVDMRRAPPDPFPRPLARARSEFNIASSNASVASNDYGASLRPRSLRPQDLQGPQSRVRALYSYLSSGEHQLSFHEGDVIGLIGDRNKGWQYGENQRNHRRGWFPIAYTAVLSEDSILDIQNGHAELQRRSSELASPYSYSGVSRSRTTPNMRHATFRSSSSSSSSPSEGLPPPPQSAQRPLSTFVDAFTAKNLDSYQDVQFGPRILQPTPGVPLRGAPAPTSAPPGRPPLTPEEPPPASSGALRPGAAPPRRLPPLPAAAPSASLHSSNDSGFGSENPPPPLSLTTSPGFEMDHGKSRENLFSTVKLRKVITNDRSAPMMS